MPGASTMWRGPKLGLFAQWGRIPRRSANCSFGAAMDATIAVRRSVARARRNGAISVTRAESSPDALPWR